MQKWFLYTFRGLMIVLIGLSTGSATYSWFAVSFWEALLLNFINAVSVTISVKFWRRVERQFVEMEELRRDIDRLIEELRSLTRKNENN